MSLVEIRHSVPNKGRGLFAKTNIKEGDIILEELPLVSAQFLWNATCRYAACDHCMRSLETAEQMARRLTGNSSLVLPHPEVCEEKPENYTTCSYCPAVYCCVECRQLAWHDYHEVICPRSSDIAESLENLKEAWKSIHYPPESCSIMLVVRMLAKIKQSSNKTELMNQFNTMCSASVNEEEDIIHKLLGHKFKSQLDMLVALIPSFLMSEETQHWLTPAGFRSLIALIGTNGQGIGTSSLGLWVSKCEDIQMTDDDRAALNTFTDQVYDMIHEVTGDFLDCEGSGLYLMQSSCNHSCGPNAEVEFTKGNYSLTLRAKKAIAANEEIFICYLDECDRERSRHSRQKVLRENYLFNCTCGKCMFQAGDASCTSEEDDEDEDMDT
jgi:hypothetical protein